jgi:transposase
MLYRSRHCVENGWQKIKVFRRVASRFEKTLRMFELFVILSLATVYERESLWPPM